MADGDLFINSAGRAETITGADKCAQDIGEDLLTPFDGARDYGSELATLDVPQPITAFAGKALIAKKVDEAIQRLKRLQQQDPAITPQEQIDKINKIVVDQISATDFVFWVSVFLQDSSVEASSVLAVSLRHQESARFTESIQDLIRRGLDQP